MVGIMLNRRACFCLLTLLLAAPVANWMWLTARAAPSPAPIAPRMKILQDRFCEIALMTEEIQWNLLQRFPAPDWVIRADEQQHLQHYDYVINHFTNRFPENSPLAERIRNERRSYHFDALALTPVTSEWTTQESLRGLRNYDLQRDPFLPEAFLGYTASRRDFCLISVGPDGDADILGFVQLANGSYQIDGDVNVPSSTSEVRRLGLRRFTPEGIDPTSPEAQINVPCELVYDPTNGASSNGDVVFQRRHGDDFLFSYPSSGIIRRSNLIRKPISE